MGSESEIEVRHAAMEDLIPIMELWKGLVRGEARYEERFEPDAENLRRYGGFVATLIEDDYCLVAEAGDKLVGYVVFGPENHPMASTRRMATITDVYVDEGRRASGVGRELVDAALAQLRDEGFERVRLFCYIGNEAAVRFYGKLGFGPLGQLMVKDL